MVQPGTGIIFDSPYNTYFAGATVTGRVEIVLNKPKKLRGKNCILFQVSGGADVKWTERQTRHVNGRSQSYSVTYYAKEEYFKMKYYCIGGQDTIILPPNSRLSLFDSATT
ncbi:hypothetical protein MML48_9g00018889 [Holotrichia oblita]|uniref:Uncharacterized protein n=1 Tax=Holotrichia oblita TaxID=644536 RepID=A0ACB9SHC8_HOLOL|nr:hypothetical protein MML48_9g00018889 [Holotrichia oblita]